MRLEIVARLRLCVSDLWSAAFLLFLLAACARTPTPSPPSETLVIASSSALSPLLEQLAQAFEVQHPSVEVIVEAHNSTYSIDQAANGAAALAATAGTPPEGMWAAPIAIDAIAVVVHADNPLEALTLAQLYDVFAGRTWHWIELGVHLVEDEVTVISREGGSSTRAAFETQVMAQGPDCQPIAAFELGSAPAEQTSAVKRPPDNKRSPCEPDPVTPTALLRVGSAAVIAYVAEHPSSIGYVAHGYLADNAPVKALRIEGASPTPAHIADGSYRLSLPLYLVAPEEPSGAARQFVDYCLSARGQALVARQYVPARSR